ncbi:MAG: TatD family hydrolase [Gemmatimonadaceae bacterium]|nr:TatD family hydrolase [Gemmatimonadaceae bacterium]
MAAPHGGKVVFIDSHAHLADPAFDGDRDAVVGRARDAGAEAIICIGESLTAAAAAERIAQSQAGFVFFTAGVHPHDATEFDAARDLPLIEKSVHSGAVAIGECGLDYHYDNSPREKQRAAFAAQIALAEKLGRPLVVHTRDAEDDTGAMIDEAGASGVRGVLHCYTGSQSLAERAIAQGWYVSFSGIVTFKKWDDDDLLRLVPNDRLLVESDSPFLAPVPNRGKRNEPAWVASTLARLAAARGVSADSLGLTTAANTRALFALPTASSAAS